MKKYKLKVLWGSPDTLRYTASVHSAAYGHNYSSGKGWSYFNIELEPPEIEVRI